MKAFLIIFGLIIISAFAAFASNHITKQTKKIKDTKGAFFTVTFVKRTDGTTRTMNARFGVKKYLKGGELPYDPIAKGLLPVFDMQKNAYRMINTDTLIGAKIGNEQYIVK